MKKVYERPDVEIHVFKLTKCILSSKETPMQEQVTEFTDPDPNVIGEL